MGCVPNIIVTVMATLVWALSAAAEKPLTDTAAAVQQEAEKGNYRLIDVDELWEIYQDNETNALLIDTRQEWEFQTGHIAGSAHFSMETTWFARLIQRGPMAQALGPDKDRILVFY